MAIDKSKRKIIGGMPFIPTPPTPDGATDKDDRAALAGVSLPSTAGEGIPSGTGLLSRFQQDTLDFLDQWGETLTIRRRSNVYDDTGMATVTWTGIGDLNGDWQPLPGSTFIEEEGLEVKSSSQIIAVYDAIVMAGDRIYREDGTYEYVNYTRPYEDHMTIRMTMTEVS